MLRSRHHEINCFPAGKVEPTGMRPLSRYALEAIIIFPGGGIDFPHGNHGTGIVLDYSLDESGVVRFEQWWSDGPFNPAAVLKQSEPGYKWTERSPNNWLGTALGKQALHACYQHARTNSRLYIAPLPAVPDKGQGGFEFWDYQDTLTSPLHPSKN